jgi:NADH:ubiquinone oxidoreductase subunit 2 (subunit N)
MLIGVLFYLIFPIDGIQKYEFVSWIYSTIALILILIAWTERVSSVRSWIYIAISQVFFMLSVVQQHSFELIHIILYLSGTLVSFVIGSWCLKKVESGENKLSLNEFHGHIYEHPRIALLFLLCALTMIGFPISPTFLGLDIMFSKIELEHRFLLITSSLTFIFLELSVLRIYARIFLGMHLKTYHEVAYRNS